MLRLARVLAGMLVRRGVAAADGAAGQAHPQVDPFIAEREAFRAALAVRRDALDRVPMGAADGARVQGGRASMLLDEP